MTDRGACRLHVSGGAALRGLSLFVAVIVGSQAGSPARAQWATHPDSTLFAPPNDVSFSIATDSAAYSVRDEITVTYRILNVSNHALYVPARTRSGTCDELHWHVTGWFEDSAGRHSIRSVAGSCPKNLPDVEGASVPVPAVPLTERMSQDAALLEPGDHLEGTISLRSGNLPPGPYRLEASLSGWSQDNFTDAERADLPKLGSPLLRGELSTSMRITLTPA